MVKKPKAASQQPETVRLNVTMDQDWLPLLDEWRKGEPDLPSRPEAARRILAQAIGVKSPGRKGRRGE